MIGALVLAGVLASVPRAGGPSEVHTATRDVRGCLALDQGYAAATEGGLVFVDRSGVAEAPLTRFDGLPETRSYVVESVAGHDDQLWVGTEGGLARVTHGEAGALVLASHPSPAPVRAVIEHDGRTFVGTWGAGVMELRGDRLQPLADSTLTKADRVTELVVHDGELVVATAGAGAWTLREHEGVEQLEQLDGVDGLVWSLAVHEGSLYAGTFVGVRRVDGPSSTTVSTHDARALASVDGALLIGSHDRGLERLGSEVSFGLARADVQGLDADRCVATTAGLWIRAGRQWISTLDEGLPSGDVTDLLARDDGALWVSTFDRGLAIYKDGAWTTIDDPEGRIDPQVNALEDAGDGRVWVATARGLHRVGDDGIETWTEKRGLPNHTVLSLARTRSGELVVGTHAGVAIIDAHGDVRRLGSRARSWATWAIAEAPDGELWLGTTQGLIRWKLDGTWDHLSMLSGHLSDNWVTALLLEGEVLHVGSYAGGVDTLTRDGNVWRAEALGGGRVNPGGLSMVDGRLQVATMKGVLERRGDRWIEGRQGLFEDATVVLETPRGVWAASRRGLALW